MEADKVLDWSGTVFLSALMAAVAFGVFGLVADCNSHCIERVMPKNEHVMCDRGAYAVVRDDFVLCVCGQRDGG